MDVTKQFRLNSFILSVLPPCHDNDDNVDTTHLNITTGTSSSNGVTTVITTEICKILMCKCRHKHSQLDFGNCTWRINPKTVDIVNNTITQHLVK